MLQSWAEERELAHAFHGLIFEQEARTQQRNAMSIDARNSMRNARRA
jgi:hypothetical protein